MLKISKSMRSMKTTTDSGKLHSPEIDGHLLILVKVFVKFRKKNILLQVFFDLMSDY